MVKNNYAAKGINCSDKTIEDIAKFVPLSREKEYQFGEVRERLRARIEKLEGLLSYSEIGRRLERNKKRLVRVRDWFYKKNLDLPSYAAQRYVLKNSDEDFEEIEAENRFKMFDAIDGFDHKRGFKFSTYAMKSFFTHGQTRYSKKRRDKAITSLDMPATEFNSSFVRFIEDRKEKGPVYDVIVRESVEIICSVLNELEINDPRMKKVVELRTGLNSEGRRFTLEEVGGIIGLTKEAVRRIQNKAYSLIIKRMGGERKAA